MDIQATIKHQNRIRNSSGSSENSNKTSPKKITKFKYCKNKQRYLESQKSEQ